VSVVLPVYNNAAYLAERLDSIARQTHPIHELIVLDDASTDGSVADLERLLPRCGIPWQLIANERNSGRVTAQWDRGARLATGDYVWLAEADDVCRPAFLQVVLRGFDHAGVVVSFCQSRQIDAQGAVLADDYLDYVADVSRDKWLRPYVEEGGSEVRTALAVKNTIPNVSAVVFRRDALLHALTAGAEELSRLRVAGDWMVYLRALELGRIAFSPRPLNGHRRHPSGVTLSALDLSQLREIVFVQRWVRERWNPEASVVDKARRHAERLYRQFGLATADAPALHLHPEFRDLYPI
jgi:hypothetical protein